MHIESVTKKFGDFTAVDSVTAELAPGRIYVIAGPNGAGKTTLMRIIAGLIRPTSGRAMIPDGSRVGVMMQESYLYRDLTPRENLELYCRLYDVSNDRMDRVKELLELDDFFDHDVAILSHGQKQRVSLARALLPEPEMLLLDEPFLGLDASAVGHVQKFLRDFRDGGGLAVIVTHELELVRELADELLLLERGKIKYFGGFNV